MQTEPHYSYTIPTLPKKGKIKKKTSPARRILKEGVESEEAAVSGGGGGGGVGIKELVLRRPEIRLQAAPPNRFQYLVPVNVAGHRHLLAVPVHLHLLHPCNSNHNHKHSLNFTITTHKFKFCFSNFLYCTSQLGQAFSKPFLVDSDHVYFEFNCLIIQLQSNTTITLVGNIE